MTLTYASTLAPDTQPQLRLIIGLTKHLVPATNGARGTLQRRTVAGGP